MSLYCYRAQWSLGKVMFLQASVILLTGGVPDQVHPPGPGTPWRPGTPPWGQVHPPDQVHPLVPGTPTTLHTRYTPQDQVHPPRPGTPPRTKYTITPQHRACWEIRSMCGRYASYWNAILFELCKHFKVLQMHSRVRVFIHSGDSTGNFNMVSEDVAIIGALWTSELTVQIQQIQDT